MSGTESEQNQEMRGGIPPSLARFAAIWPMICAAIVDHGFTVSYHRLETPKTGIFDGHQILLKPGLNMELQCFTLLHLFGHSVQWVAPSLEHKLAGICDTKDFTRFLKSLHEYEYDAARYGLQLLHELDIRDLDGWFSDFVETDWRYLEHFYLTGTLGQLEDFVTSGTPRVEPWPIPELRHRRVEPRYAF